MTGTLVPFTQVDELGCYFDDPAEPNSIHFELHLSGHLDPARLRTAVLAALAAHPLARARRGRWHSWDRRLHWEIADRPDVPPIDVVHWQHPCELAEQRQRLLDVTPSLDLAPPLRIRHAIGPDWDALIVNIHHAAMDGMSGLRLLRSVARRYAGRPDPVGANPLAVRAPPAPPAGAARPVRPATRITVDSAGPAPGCGFQLLSMPYHSVHSGPRSAATVNDLLIAALVRAVASWNASHGVPTGTVRITLPVNARTGGDEPLGNLSRLAVIANEPDQRDSGEQLLADIVAQTSTAKRTGGPQVDPLTGLMAAPWLPVAVKMRLPMLARRLAGSAGSDTTLVSNLGIVDDPPDFGDDATAVGLWMSAPARMPRGLSVGAITVRDKLHLCFRYRKALFDEPAAARFAESCRAALESFGDPRIGTPTVGTPTVGTPSPGDSGLGVPALGAHRPSAARLDTPELPGTPGLGAPGLGVAGLSTPGLGSPPRGPDP